jgi:hypothetical protein
VRARLVILAFAHLLTCSLIFGFWHIIESARGYHYVSQLEEFGILHRWTEAPLIPLGLWRVTSYFVTNEGWTARSSFEMYGHWASYIVLVLALAHVLQRIYPVRTMRHRDGICDVCGYDLRATPERCPECGTRVEEPATQQSNPLRGPWWATAAICVATLTPLAIAAAHTSDIRYEYYRLFGYRSGFWWRVVTRLIDSGSWDSVGALWLVCAMIVVVASCRPLETKGRKRTADQCGSRRR